MADEYREAPGRANFLGRRRALAGLGGIALSLPILAACTEDEATSRPGSRAPARPAGPADGSTSEEPTTPADASATAEEGGAAGLTSTRDIPVGGGAIFTDARVVVAQPETGTFTCFSAVCTHTGCLVTSVASTIVCACHGSSFDLATGEVLGGPAPAPLPPVDFAIDKDQVVLT